MARAIKWMVAVVLAVATFSLTVWGGMLTSGWIFSKGFSASDKLAVVLAAATLLATVVFAPVAGWAQGDPKQAVAATDQNHQKITGTFSSNSGISGNNIIGDVHYE